MPPKIRKFLGIIYGKAYLNEADDLWVVFEESDFLKGGFSVGEIEEVLVYLKRENVIAQYNTYPVSRDIKHFPITKQEKIIRLRSPFWWKFRQLFFAGNNPKDRYILELVSRDVVSAFYNRPLGQLGTSTINVVVKNKKFPQDLQWSELTINFLNGEEVIIKYRDVTLQTNAEEMGFLDKKTKAPNTQWRLMLQLASHGGELTWTNNKDFPKSDIDTLKKRKQMLVAGLQEYFGITGDPFYPYRENKAYRMKITIVPENIGLKPEDNLGIQDFHKTQTPNIYDASELTE